MANNSTNNTNNELNNTANTMPRFYDLLNPPPGNNTGNRAANGNNNAGDAKWLERFETFTQRVGGHYTWHFTCPGGGVNGPWDVRLIFNRILIEDVIGHAPGKKAAKTNLVKQLHETRHRLLRWPTLISEYAQVEPVANDDPIVDGTPSVNGSTSSESNTPGNSNSDSN